MNLEFAVCLPRDAETVSLVRNVASTALRAFGVTEECTFDIQLALTEACNNVVDHASLDDEYEVRLQITENKCWISVVNTAAGFDSSGLDAEMPDPSSPRGRGVAIMWAVMDAVEFSSEPSARTIVNLVKSLDLEPDAPLARLGRT